MRWSTRLRSLLALFAALVGLLLVPATPASAQPESGGRAGWTGAWTASMQAATDFGFFPNWSVDGFDNHSVREVARVSIGGSKVRIRLSNVYGSAPLRVAGATIAKAGDGASVRPGTLRPLTFRHSLSTVIPVGRETTSDATFLHTEPLERLSVTLYLAMPTGPATFHQTAFSNTYRAVGDHRFDRTGQAFTESNQASYLLSGVEVAGVVPRHRDAVVAFGDSITDGAMSTPDADNRYPDELAERLVDSGRRLAVLNAGISGNLLLRDSPCFGEKAIARFQRDALDQPGVRTVIVLLSTNDLFSIGLPAPNECGVPNPDLTVEQLIDGQRSLIRAAHARGVKIIGATVLPYKDNTFGLFTERGEAIRDALNQWIRTSGEFDGVVDFERVTADPADPDKLRPEYDAGDHVHPNDAGFHAMAAEIDLGSL